MQFKFISIFITIILFGSSLFGQGSIVGQDQTQEHLTQALNYTSISFFAEASEEFDKALAIAEKFEKVDKVNAIKIAYAEMLRKSNQLEEGFSLLNGIEIEDKNDILG